MIVLLVYYAIGTLNLLDVPYYLETAQVLDDTGERNFSSSSHCDVWDWFRKAGELLMH